jgi:hypothetical protein
MTTAEEFKQRHEDLDVDAISLREALENSLEFAKFLEDAGEIDPFHSVLKLHKGIERVNGNDGNLYFISNVDIASDDTLYVLPFVASSGTCGHLTFSRFNEYAIEGRPFGGEFYLYSTKIAYELLEEAGINFLGDSYKANEDTLHHLDIHPLTIFNCLDDAENFYGKRDYPEIYTLKVGPEIRGRRYDTREIMDMTVDKFIKLHSSSAVIPVNLLRYFRHVGQAVACDKRIKGYRDEQLKMITVKEVVEMPLIYARKTRNVGEKSINDAVVYMSDVYGISLK